jgi:hypothetical protein
MPMNRRRVSRLPGSALAGLACLACLLAPPPATADAQPYAIGISESVSHDNNLIRLADGQTAPEGYSRSDSVQSTAVQAGIDQGFGRQQLVADLSLRDLRYRANPTFDHQGYTASTALNWSSAGRLSGTLLATANRSLATFNNEGVGLIRERNCEDTKGLNGNLSLGLAARYSLDLSASRRQVSNTLDDQRVRARNFRQTASGLTAYWRPGSATRIGLGLRDTRGEYPRFRQLAGGFEADRFRQQALELTAAVQPTGASNIDLRLGQSRTRYDLNPERSFSGLTGALSWNWQATGKLRLGTRISRDTGQDSYAITVFGNVPGASDTSRLVHTLQFNVGFDPSAKLNFNGNLQRSQRQVVQTVINPFVPLSASGRDNTTLLSVGARWLALRSVSLGCDLRREVRTASGQLVAPLHNSGLSCFGQLRFL